MSNSSNDPNNSGSLPFAPTLRKVIVLMVICFAVPIVILLALTHLVNSSNPTDTASAASQPAVAASTASAAHK